MKPYLIPGLFRTPWNDPPLWLGGGGSSVTFAVTSIITQLIIQVTKSAPQIDSSAAWKLCQTAAAGDKKTCNICPRHPHQGGKLDQYYYVSRPWPPGVTWGGGPPPPHVLHVWWLTARRENQYRLRIYTETRSRGVALNRGAARGNFHHSAVWIRSDY